MISITKRLIFILLFIALTSCGSGTDGINLPNISNLPGDTNTFGSLSLSGTDTSRIGTTFSAEAETTSNLTLGQVSASWGDAVSIVSQRATLVAVTFDRVTAAVTAVALIHTTDKLEWTYLLDCSTVPCTNISVDLGTKTVTFNDLSVPVNTENAANQAMNSISLKGSLVYTIPR